MTGSLPLSRLWLLIIVSHYCFSKSKGTRQSVRIIWVSVLSGLSEKSLDKCFISARTNGDISTATKEFFNVTASVTVISSNLKTLRLL